MSANAIELVFWTTTTNEAEAVRYCADPAGYLAKFRLTEDERSAIVAGDWRELDRRGINHMLLFAFFQRVRGRAYMSEYLGAMATP